MKKLKKVGHLMFELELNTVISLTNQIDHVIHDYLTVNRCCGMTFKDVGKWHS